LLKQIPNALTLLRLILAPAVTWLMWMATQAPTQLEDLDAWEQRVATCITAAAVLFVIAALTDLFDGMLARALNAHTKFGRIIDPIADKALVGLPLIFIAVAMWQGEDAFWPVVAIATAVIVCRDVLMTVVRLTAPDREGARVSSLAKIKTALELFVIGSLLVISSTVAVMTANDTSGEPMFVPYGSTMQLVWIGLLVLAATLSAWTAYQYLAPRPKA
jgi:CDP-diacylglycerol--glycerol-3-phosphate 3-phosphatidyltransferase